MPVTRVPALSEAEVAGYESPTLRKDSLGAHLSFLGQRTSFEGAVHSMRFGCSRCRVRIALPRAIHRTAGWSRPRVCHIEFSRLRLGLRKIRRDITHVLPDPRKGNRRLGSGLAVVLPGMEDIHCCGSNRKLTGLRWRPNGPG